MTSELELNLKNRERLISDLKEEIIGPTVDFQYSTGITESSGKELRHSGNNYYYKYGNKNEEIFTAGKPSRTYAAGLLYPRELKSKTNNQESDSNEEVNTQKSMKESSMGYTFAVPENGESLILRFDCGMYTGRNDYNYDLQTPSYDKNATKEKWWFRRSLYLETNIPLLRKNSSEEFKLKDNLGEEQSDGKIRLHTHVRKINLKDNKTIRIVTVSIENISSYRDEEEAIMFQCTLNSRINGGLSFIDYPKASDLNIEINDEDKNFEMLYLDEKNYSFGHNCSTTWKEENGDVVEVSTTFLPEYETLTMTPDITIKGEPLEIHHLEIISAKGFEEIKSILKPLTEGYRGWLGNLKNKPLNPYYAESRKKNLINIEAAIERIEKGISLLKNEKIFDSFKLSNLAMLMQMNNGKEIRKTSRNGDNLIFDKPFYNSFEKLKYSSIDELTQSARNIWLDNSNHVAFKKSKWRGFQIAFLLQSLNSIVDKESKDRSTVDLIWFPTGGGKTEAYLGVAAFSMLYRRTLNPKDKGVDVIMRYTLRLLTTDQFQRAARLITSLEYIRRRYEGKLGKDTYSIGLWVGSQSTPNTHKQAINDIKNKKEFLINSCPWCGAEIKIIQNDYEGFSIGEQVECYCPDASCDFHEGIPIQIVDEYMYENPPTFLIGTVDKFIQLSWKEDVRAFFGIDKNGKRTLSPPNLIIQDELHLISGPLGSLTGMYEVLIEELSTDYRDNNVVKPKIVAATATIKSYEEQIKNIFAREQTNLFPPSGLSISDNFFSKIKYYKNNEKFPGRKYIGVYTSTQGMLQTQVQTFTSLLATPLAFNEKQRDPYWTILSFYNSLNDIGKAKVLTDMDIPNNLERKFEKKAIKKEERRRIYSSNVKELTSRESNSNISKSLSELKIGYRNLKDNTIDVCLASNIIEVGVDIDRLSLMTIIGQPKTTSQYIQVSGRVGRKTDERPGLVVTVYNNTSSNDKSHFEHFNEYHQKLYAQVEVNSVTPFSQFAIKRGLPAIIIGYIRQKFEKDTLGRYPIGEKIDENIDEISQFITRVIERAKLVDDSEVDLIKHISSNILTKLMENTYDEWKYTSKNNGFMAQINDQEDELPDTVEQIIFSMRNVEQSSLLSIMSKTKEDKKRFSFL